MQTSKKPLDKMIIMGVHGKTPFRFQSKLGRKTTIPHIIKVTRYMATPSHCIIMCWPQISFNTMLSSELVPIVWQVLIKRIWQTLFFLLSMPAANLCQAILNNSILNSLEITATVLFTVKFNISA